MTSYYNFGLHGPSTAEIHGADTTIRSIQSAVPGSRHWAAVLVAIRHLLDALAAVGTSSFLDSRTATPAQRDAHPVNDFGQSRE